MRVMFLTVVLIMCIVGVGVIISELIRLEEEERNDK